MNGCDCAIRERNALEAACTTYREALDRIKCWPPGDALFAVSEMRMIAAQSLLFSAAGATVQRVLEAAIAFISLPVGANHDEANHRYFVLKEAVAALEERK